MSNINSRSVAFLGEIVVVVVTPEQISAIQPRTSLMFRAFLLVACIARMGYYPATLLVSLVEVTLNYVITVSFRCAFLC